MKKRLLPLAALFISGFAYSQVGIGTLDPNKSAELEVKSSNKGVLIPQVYLTSLTDATTIQPNNVQSLLVYNTNNTIKELEAGYYFWNIDKWDLLVSETVLPSVISNNIENIFNNPTTKNYLENLIKNVGGDVTFDGNTFTYNIIVKDSNGDDVKDAQGNIVKETKTITVKELVEKAETETTLVDNGDGTYTYTNEKGTVTTIDVPDSVKNNFENIFNNDEYKKFISEFLENNAIHNVTYDGTTFWYVDDNGVKQTIDFSAIVKRYETQTTIVETTPKSGIYTYTAEGGTFTIDIPASVINNFEDIFNEEEIKKFISKYLEENAIHNVTYDGTTFWYVDKDGVKQTIDFSAIVKGYETNTTIVKHTTEKGVYVYNNEKGDNAVDINVPEAVIESFEKIIKNQDVKNLLDLYLKTGAINNVTYDGDNFTYVDSEGNVKIIDIAGLVKKHETNTTIVKHDSKKGVYVYNNEKGNNAVEIDVPEALSEAFQEFINKKDIQKILNEFLKNFAKNIITYEGDTFSYIDENGDKQTIDFGVIVKRYETKTFIKEDVEKSGIYKYTSEEGIYTIDVPASVINNFQDIINKDEIQNILNEFLEDKAVHNVTFDGKIFSYIDDKKVKKPIPIAKIVKENQTLTSLGLTEEEQQGSYPGQLIKTYTLTYADENEHKHSIDLSAIVKQEETLTKLQYDSYKNLLSYSDEKGEVNDINLIQMVGGAETLTFLTVDDVNKKLVYKDEDKNTHKLDLSQIVQEPWFGVESKKGAVSNTEDIFTRGWVGIGYDKPSGLADEKLRVKGAITAVNSYYADYVFEDYFDGFSNIKYDYKFKDLDTVEDFIKSNRHLPGITPINQLEKTDEGYSFNVSELSIQLLEKTEELYLHIIDQKKENDQKIQQIQKSVEESNKAMQDRLDRLENLLIKKLENEGK